MLYATKARTVTANIEVYSKVSYILHPKGTRKEFKEVGKLLA